MVKWPPYLEIKFGQIESPGNYDQNLQTFLLLESLFRFTTKNHTLKDVREDLGGPFGGC